MRNKITLLACMLAFVLGCAMHPALAKSAKSSAKKAKASSEVSVEAGVNASVDAESVKDTKTSENIKVSEDKKKFLKQKKIKVKKVMSRWIGYHWNEKSDKFNLVQGFCSDGKYFYIALTSSDNGDKEYKSQVTKLLKIDIKTKKEVCSKNVGKIGHSNSICYNPSTDKIYTAPCTKVMSYCYEFNASDFSGMKKRYFKKKDGKKYEDKNFSSIAFDPLGKQFVVKMSNDKIAFFDERFTLKKSINVEKNLKIEGDVKDKNGKVIKASPYTGQALSCDGVNIFSVCTKFGNPNKNYILCYDMDGKFLKKYTIQRQIGKDYRKPEMEQLACVDGKYWSLSNINFYDAAKKYAKHSSNGAYFRKLRIHKLTLKG